MPAAAGQIITHAGSLTTLAIIGLLPGSTDILAGMSLGGRVQGMLMFPLTAVNMSVVMLSGHLLGSGAGDGLYSFGRRTALRTGLLPLPPRPSAVSAAGTGRLLFLRRSARAATGFNLSCVCLPFPTIHGHDRHDERFFSGAGATPFCHAGSAP